MARPKFLIFSSEATSYVNESLMNMPSTDQDAAVQLIKKWSELTQAHIEILRKNYDIEDGASPVGMGGEEEAAWKKWCTVAERLDTLVSRTLQAAEEWAKVFNTLPLKKVIACS